MQVICKNMKQQNSNSIFIVGFLLFLLLCSLATSAIAQEVEDEREFDYGEGSKKGPQRWGELKKEWKACKNGEMQSPIDMSNHRVKLVQDRSNSTELKRSYKPSNATIKNRGHDISLQWVDGDAGSIEIDGTDYFLKQAHWHSPSEHSIDGIRYNMELHMVHVSQDLNVKNKIAVVGLLYKIGPPDAFLSQLMSNISLMTKKVEARNMEEIDPREITLGGGTEYYRYIGSLTVPPCTEGVIWIIKEQIRTVSGDQVNLMRNVVHDYADKNARPVQPVNGRDIHLYGP